jgi:diamine N-acetyltransferase
MTIQFQNATPADIDLLLTLMQEYYAYDGHHFEASRLRQALGDLLASEFYGCTWLILDGDTVIGYMAICFGYSLEFGGRDAFIDEIYLREAYRGQGIGTGAIQHMLDTCRAKGIEALHLEVMPGNTDALRLYERVGFVNRRSSLMSQMVYSLRAAPAD